MPWTLVRHKVADYSTWKPVFDEHASARREVGSKGGYVFRSADDPNEVIILIEVADLERAREFAESDDLRETMERAGVTDQPDVYFLELADRPEV